MPLYIKPDKKISVHDVMGLMRDHYEGTELDMTKGVAAGPYQMPYRWRPLTWEYNGEEYFHERPISTPQTGFSFVSQARANLPREVGGLFWFGVDDTYFTVYTPMYSSMTKVPYNFSHGVGSLSDFTWDSAFWVFNFVANFSYPRYSVVIDDVKMKQNELEGRYFAQQENIESTALSLLKNSKGEAIEYLTNYSITSAENTYKTWKQFGEHLLLKYMDGLSKTELFKPKNIGYPEEFKKLIVEESGDALKMKTLTTDQTAVYNENIKIADKLLNEKKYSEAKGYYEKALAIKPTETYPKEKIDKLNSILGTIEELHKKTF
jgi:dipeptidase